MQRASVHERDLCASRSWSDMARFGQHRRYSRREQRERRQRVSNGAEPQPGNTAVGWQEHACFEPRW
jgi:hypothetical protein